MSLTETNQQYYQGAQEFISAAGANQKFPTTFNTNLILGDWSTSGINYGLNNFKVYTSGDGTPGSWVQYTSELKVENNTIEVVGNLSLGTYIAVQLTTLDGGNYATTLDQQALGSATEDNYGSYEYIKLSDVIDNFMVGYVGDGKLIQKAKKSDVLFFAKRSLQEFSYDTLKSIKSTELTIPKSLSIVIPQDYVNYVRMSWIDHLGVKRLIYPANSLTISPYETPLQDGKGVPTQDSYGENIEGTSITEERWKSANTNIINTDLVNNIDEWAYWANAYGEYGNWNTGQLYGLDPQYAQANGWFNMNEREGKISFSSNLVDKLIVLEYISDGLAHDGDTKVPKLAEEALYASILHYIISTRANQPEYLVQRLKKERGAKLRNTKIRLSNIKLDEIVQVMRGKSKWIKH